eukprot:1199055-Rhodomonas_salina.4
MPDVWERQRSSLAPLFFSTFYTAVLPPDTAACQPGCCGHGLETETRHLCTETEDALLLGQTLDRREIQAVKDKVFCSGDPRMPRERQKRTGGHWELLSRSPARTDGGKGVEGGPRD